MARALSEHACEATKAGADLDQLVICLQRDAGAGQDLVDHARATAPEAPHVDLAVLVDIVDVVGGVLASTFVPELLHAFSRHARDRNLIALRERAADEVRRRDTGPLHPWPRSLRAMA